MFNFSVARKYNAEAINGWVIILANRQLYFFEKDAIIEEKNDHIVVDSQKLYIIIVQPNEGKPGARFLAMCVGLGPEKSTAVVFSKHQMMVIEEITKDSIYYKAVVQSRSNLILAKDKPKILPVSARGNPI